MRKIVVIGGGSIRKFDTISIDRRIVSLTKKRNPMALFIPTASSDSRRYYLAFQALYGKKLGCKTEPLYLLNNSITIKNISKI